MLELWDWKKLLLAAFIFIFALLLRKLFARVVLKQLKKFAATTESALDNNIIAALEPPFKFLFIVVGFYLATLVLPADIDETLTPLIRSLVAFTLFWAFFSCVEPLSVFIDKLTLKFGTELTLALKNFFVKGLKIFIALIGLTAILNEWGINVIGLIASLSLFSFPRSAWECLPGRSASCNVWEREKIQYLQLF